MYKQQNSTEKQQQLVKNPYFQDLLKYWILYFLLLLFFFIAFPFCNFYFKPIFAMSCTLDLPQCIQTTLNFTQIIRLLDFAFI